jgi:hypothetical protein
MMMKKRPIACGGVIRRCRKGEKLCKQHSGKRVTFSMQPSGVPVPPRHARAAMGSGELVPLYDDLLGDNWQTWAARKGPSQ